MATQTLSLASFQDGAAEMSVDYDDVTLRLQTVRVRNDGVPFTLHISLSDPTTGVVFFEASRSLGEGTTTQNVNGANVHMVIIRDSPRLPFTVQISS